MSFKVDDMVTLKAGYPDGNEPAQRAKVLEVQGASMYMVCIFPEDRLPDDYDGLTEIHEEGIEKLVTQY